MENPQDRGEPQTVHVQDENGTRQLTFRFDEAADEYVLTGDAYKDVERALAPGFSGDVEVLKVGHHGSDTSTDPALLGALRPQVALVSVGRFNRYGHPAPEVVRRLVGSGARLYRTDREGTVSVSGRSDGSFSVAVQR